jgi:single-strand DNA-binding protein
MNSLNSILLEGELIDEPENVTKDDGTGLHCVFNIVSHRFFKVDDDHYEKEDSFFTIRVKHNKLAQICLDHLHKGNCVRVVGRLKQDRWREEEGYGGLIGDSIELVEKSEIIIIAEHIEFKSNFNNNSIKSMVG